MPVDIAAKYIGRAEGLQSTEVLGHMMRGGDGNAYLVDKTGFAWQLGAMGGQSGGAPKKDSGTGDSEASAPTSDASNSTPNVGAPGGPDGDESGVPSMQDVYETLNELKWITIEDPSTAGIPMSNSNHQTVSIFDNKSFIGPGGVAGPPISKVTIDYPPGVKHIEVKHPFAYAMPKDRRGLRDYCARRERLVSLEGDGPPTVGDLIDLIFNMTLHYKGDHGVFVKTSNCQPQLWAAHFHHMLSFDGCDIKQSGDTVVFTVRCKSIEERPAYITD